MCQFFSFVTKGSQRYYFNWEQRQQLLINNPNDYNPDSHTSICNCYKLDEDKVNKYEFDPLLKTFTVDQINIKNDQAIAKKWVSELNFKTVIEPLIIKPIINPFNVIANNFEHITLLQQWDSVRDSVVDSVRDSVGESIGESVVDSVRDSVGESIGESVWNSVVNSIGEFVGESIWDSVVDSVWKSIWKSIWDSVWAYISSFFILETWIDANNKSFENPFQCLIDLWELGFVPSFDGKTWRIHQGVKAEVIFEISKEELKALKF